MAEWAYPVGGTADPTSQRFLHTNITLTRVNEVEWDLRSLPHPSEHGSALTWEALLLAISVAVIRTELFRGKTVVRIDLAALPSGEVRAFLTMQPGATVWLMDDRTLSDHTEWRHVRDRTLGLASTCHPID